MMGRADTGGRNESREARYWTLLVSPSFSAGAHSANITPPGQHKAEGEESKNNRGTYLSNLEDKENESKMDIIITADGGGGECHEMPCYGSVHLQGDGQERIVRFDLPEYKTSNEAEYMAVVRGLEEVQKDTPRATVLVRSDSKLVIMQCRRKWKVEALNLRPLRDRVLQLASTFPAVHFQWIPGRDVKALLGH